MSSSSAANANIARHLPLVAARQPGTPALKVPRSRTADGRIDYLALSYAELAGEVAAWQATMTARGVRRGDRTLVMVRPGLPLIAAVFALFGLGAVPVVIDPGMGRKSFLACVARSRPRALVGIPLARLVSRVFRREFASVEVRVPASGKPTARLTRAAPAGASPAIVESAANELAAVLFTSGSTGAPKGVCYTHGMFDAQVRLIREAYGIQPGEIDLPMLPIFALFNPALGMTTVVPEIDPSRPAAVDPAKIVQAIRQENVTNSFGSPTLWHKIAMHCAQHDVALPSVRRVLSAGAPVPPELWTSSRRLLPGGELHSPYGATEALPVSTISAREVLEDTAAATLGGRGTCVGRVIAGNAVKIIALADAPLAGLEGTRELPAGEIGEIIVSGPTVTREYDQLPDATAAAKIAGKDGAVWHRMGDCGYLDASGRLWFCGRKAERVETSDGSLFTEQVEPIFNALEAVRRCALIGLGDRGRQRPAVVVEPADPTVINSSERCRRLARELRQLALQQTSPIRRINLFYFHPAFPVDVRHNAKIHRLTLARWAMTATGYESDPKR
ncbi:MAG TPA: fatty acid CoA ligase family protein [Opitutaceae bacterium]